MSDFVLPISQYDRDNQCVVIGERTYIEYQCHQLEEDGCVLFYQTKTGIVGHGWIDNYAYIYDINRQGYVNYAYDIHYIPYNQPVDIGYLYRTGAMYGTLHRPTKYWYLRLHYNYINEVDAELIRMIGTNNPYPFYSLSSTTDDMMVRLRGYKFKCHMIDYEYIQYRDTTSHTYYMLCTYTRVMCIIMTNRCVVTTPQV